MRGVVDEPNELESANAIIEQADRLGVVVLPTLIGLGYGIYMLISESMKTTNGGVLVLLCGLTLFFTPAYRRSKLALIPAYLLANYMFGIIGCIALVLAIFERAGWGTLLLALLWIILGWRLLGGAARLRRA